VFKNDLIDVLNTMANEYGIVDELALVKASAQRLKQQLCDSATEHSSDSDKGPLPTLDWQIHFEIATSNKAALSTKTLSILHEIVWALSRKDVEFHMKNSSIAFFKNFKLLRGVRVCAPMISSNGFASEAQSFIAQVDIVDRLDLCKDSGIVHFGRMFTDALSAIADIEASQVTILGLHSIESTMKNNSSRYKVIFEIRFMHDPSLEELQQVYDAMWMLHSEVTRIRWAELPFFRNFIFESGAIIDSPEDLRHIRSVSQPYLPPKVQAHLNVIRKMEGDDNDDSGIALKTIHDEFVGALRQSLDVSTDRITLTCVEKRYSHHSNTKLLSVIADAWREKESINGLNNAEETDDGQPTKRVGRNAPNRIHEELVAIGKDFNVKADEAFDGIGFTFRLDIVADPRLDITRQQEDLESISDRLRYFHSEAVFREHGKGRKLQFFKNFQFDCGVQIDDCLDSLQADEKHTFPGGDLGGDLGGPIIFRKPLLSPTVGKGDAILIKAHLDIMDNPERNVDNSKRKAADFRKWFGEVLEAWFKHKGSMDCIDIPYVASDTDAGAHDLWFVVTGIYEKPAQNKCLATKYLGSTEQGLEGVKFAREHKGGQKGYTVEFELRVKAANLPICSKQVALVKHKLRAFASRATKTYWLDRYDFFKQFIIDWGIMIDAKAYYKMDESKRHAGWFNSKFSCSLEPAKIKAVVRFDPTTSTARRKVELLETFPGLMALALGTSENMIREAKEEEYHGGRINVSFKIYTMTHKPASRELESLCAKLKAMNSQTSSASGDRWWLDLFPDYKPSVVSIEDGRLPNPDGDSDDANLVLFEEFKPLASPNLYTQTASSPLADAIANYIRLVEDDDLAKNGQRTHPRVTDIETIRDELTGGTRLEDVFVDSRGQSKVAAQAKKDLVRACLRSLLQYEGDVIDAGAWDPHSQPWEIEANLQVISHLCTSDETVAHRFTYENISCEFDDKEVDACVGKHVSCFVISVSGHMLLISLIRHVLMALGLTWTPERRQLLRRLLEALTSIFRGHPMKDNLHEILPTQMRKLAKAEAKEMRPIFSQLMSKLHRHYSHSILAMDQDVLLKERNNEWCTADDWEKICAPQKEDFELCRRVDVFLSLWADPEDALHRVAYATLKRIHASKDKTQPGDNNGDVPDLVVNALKLAGSWSQASKGKGGRMPGNVLQCLGDEILQIYNNSSPSPRWCNVFDTFAELAHYSDEYVEFNRSHQAYRRPTTDTPWLAEFVSHLESVRGQTSRNSDWPGRRSQEDS